MPIKKRKTYRNKNKKKNKTKRNKGGTDFPSLYKNDTVTNIRRRIQNIDDENPNAFREVVDFNEDIHHDFIQFQQTYRTWEDFFNDIRRFNESLTARERIRLFTYVFLIYILLRYPGTNNHHLHIR
jgi:hypothetical protein